MPGLRRLALCLLCLLGVLATAGRARAGDPYVRWYTVVTPHFRVHFHGGLEEVAQRVASIAEHAHERLVPELGWEPFETTHLLVADDSDAANGLASTLPYDFIRIFVSSPDDMSPLAEYDDWLTELITHEYTHILHVDNASGVPALVNAILGKTYLPNQAQPRWILEGLAVAMESRHTTGGRLRSTQFDMYLRADVLGGNLATLDQMSHPARRWPGGNLWYLYGAKFIEWITDVYGPETYGAVATDYGAQVIPWGLNRSIRRVTGRTYEELYRGWRADLEVRYRAQERAVRARGLREGRRLTRRGFQAAEPRFLPERCGGANTLYYQRDDGDTLGGVYRVDLAAPEVDASAELVATGNGRAFTFDADCNLIFENVAPTRRRYFFNDLFLVPRGERSTGGYARTRKRLTLGRRAREPDVSPDGRRIVYVTTQNGTTTLRIADYGRGGAITNERTLVPSAQFEQAYTPRFSPDGKRVAYSAWTRGGYRDIRVVDVATGRFFELYRDRALEQQPTWSPDGKTLYFASDRTGISNIYAYDLEGGALHQVTNAVTGAYMPEVSSDGRTLVYVGYTPRGFDLFALELDRRRFLPALAVAGERAEPGAVAGTHYFPVEDYDPLPTLRPRSWFLTFGQGTFGDAFIVSTSGSDAVGHHAFAAALTLETERSEPQFSVDYYYGRLPFGFRASFFHNASPRAYATGDTVRDVVETQTGASTGVAYDLPGDGDYQTTALSYTLVHFDQDLPVGPTLDPYAPIPVEPHNGYLGLIRLAYGFSNVTSTANAISAEGGLSFNVAGDFADPAWGSEDTLTAFAGSLSGYVHLPWARHHVLALAASGGAAVGTYPRYGLYSTGGFADTPAFDAFTSGIRQSSFVLRGYEPGQFVGSQYNLLNAEYRFPLVYADRGISTLPLFLRTVSGALFADFGGAFDRLDLDDPLESFHLGVGGEIWFDLVLGYYAGATLRLGYAKGLDDEAPGAQTYFVASSAF